MTKKKPDATNSVENVKKLIVEQQHKVHDKLLELKDHRLEIKDQRREMEEIEKLVTELEINLHVGTQIKNLRDDMRLSQDDIASSTGLSQSYISRIEKGEATPSKEVLGRIAVPLKTTLTALVEGTHSADALEEPTFADRYGYCPNIECPGTVYRYINGDIGDWEVLTVKQLSLIRDAWVFQRVTYNDMRGYGYDGKKDLKEFRSDHEKLEITYRWIELDENTNFCELCGTELRNSCPSCQIPLKAGNQKFCHSCGFQLNKLPEHEEGGEK